MYIVPRSSAFNIMNHRPEYKQQKQNSHGFCIQNANNASLLKNYEKLINIYIFIVNLCEKEKQIYLR
jgi:hypothetical protein